MANLPFRGLAEKGILRDPSPYQLDLNAWSAGANVRFHANKAMRAPIWRGIGPALTFRPQHCVGYRPSSGFDFVFLVGEGGRIYRYGDGQGLGTITELTAPGYVPLTTPDPRAYTSTFLGDVTYINSPVGVPHYYGPGAASFLTLPGWNADWRCRTLRAYGDYLIAMNVTKNVSASPVTVASMVKWSDLTLAGLPPDSWDATDSTKSTGENVLEEMTSPIVDGVPMRDVFVIYTGDQVWSMTQTGDTEIFKWSRLFSEGGMLAPNCGVEVDGKHYVFGTSDIYVHDGSSKQSLVDQRNRDYIFRNLDLKKSECCFVQYMPHLNEIMFAYKSTDDDAAFSGGDKCNKAAVYNVPGDTWSFVDLPNVVSMSQANVNSAITWDDAAARGLTWDTIGGSWTDQMVGYDQHVVGISANYGTSVTASRLVAYDFMNKGSLSYPFIAELNAPSYLSRTGLSLDQVGSDIVTYKNIRRVYPLVSMFADVPVVVRIGSSMTPSGNVTWGAPMDFNPITQYKVDTQAGGRYLAISFTVAAPADYEIAGFDVDVNSGGSF